MSAETPKDATTVEVPDDGTVTVDISDNPELGTVGTETDDTVLAGSETIEVEPEPAKPRQRKSAAADEASAALTAAVQAAEKEAEDQKRSREAAEATAEAERRRADEATRLAQQREQEAKSARDQADSHELTILTNGIEAANRDLLAAKDELQRASEAGEFGKAADAQVRIAKAAAAVDRLEDAKASFESGAAKKIAAKNDPPPQLQPQQNSAFERYVGQVAPRAQSWLRAHPECVPAEIGGNAAKNAAMMAGHWAAKSQNVAEGSDDYFRIIEEHAGFRQPAAAAVDPQPVPVHRPKPRLQPAAPVSREPASASTGQVAQTTRSVSLTKEQQDAARITYPQKPEREAFALYARELLQLQAEGKLGRLTH